MNRIRDFRDTFETMKVMAAILTILFSSSCFGQNQKDSLLLLNGKVYLGEITGFGISKGDSVINFRYSGKRGKLVNNEIEHRRVFSLTKNGISRTVYSPNEFAGDFLSERETHDVTIGSYDARKTFKPHVPFWTSFALGFGASVWDTYLTKKQATDSALVMPKEPGFFRGDPSVFPFFVPVVLSVTWSFPSFKLKENKMIHKNYMHNENYYRGYHRIAKQKRMLGALLGSFSGLAVGMITYYILH